MNGITNACSQRKCKTHKVPFKIDTSREKIMYYFKCTFQILIFIKIKFIENILKNFQTSFLRRTQTHASTYVIDVIFGVDIIHL